MPTSLSVDNRHGKGSKVGEERRRFSSGHISIKEDRRVVGTDRKTKRKTSTFLYFI